MLFRSAVDSAIIETAELMAELLKARKDLNISAVVGDRAASKLAEAMSALSEARSAMAKALGLGQGGRKPARKAK